MEWLASMPPNMNQAAAEEYLQIQLQLLRVRQGLPLLPSTAPPPPSFLPPPLQTGAPQQASLQAGLPQTGTPQLLFARAPPQLLPTPARAAPPRLLPAVPQFQAPALPPPQTGAPQLGFPQPVLPQQGFCQSPPKCPLVTGPLLEGVKDILSLPEAMKLLKNPPGHISDPALLKDAPGGTVFLFRASTDAQSEDWRSSGLGHHFRQTGGKPTITSVAGYNRKVFHIMLPGQIRDKRFQRITWSLEGNPRDTLIQFWGDESLSVPLREAIKQKKRINYGFLP